MVRGTERRALEERAVRQGAAGRRMDAGHGASAGVSRGRSPTTRSASLVLPDPGGPIISRWCRPPPQPRWPGNHDGEAGEPVGDVDLDRNRAPDGSRQCGGGDGGVLHSGERSYGPGDRCAHLSPRRRSDEPCFRSTVTTLGQLESKGVRGPTGGARTATWVDGSGGMAHSHWRRRPFSAWSACSPLNVPVRPPPISPSHSRLPACSISC